MMPRILASLLLLLPVFSAASGSRNDEKPYDRKEVEAKLKQILVGKVAVMQQFYREHELHFDSYGNLVGTAKIGPWTAYGRVEIATAKLGDKTLLLTGKRNVMRWEGTEMGNYTLDDDEVRITIDLPPNPSGNAISATLAKIFLFRAQRLSDIVPEYWKDFLTTERSRSAQWQQRQAEMLKDVKNVGDDVKPPKLLSKANSIEIGPAPFKDVNAETVTLQFIVDPSGSVKDVQITKPVGAGADDPVAEVIEQWKFEPATSSAGPVSVLMYAKRLIRFEKQQGMPLHPCPLATDASVCQ
ncbi:MAG: energy transducer TonB [Acidobacteriia bacterium]|nr:energy transducer TonB [Terriglobia bacterium]